MTITAKIFGNLQSGVSKVDDLRVRTPINAALQWLGEGLVDELNTHFGAVSTSISAALVTFLNTANTFNAAQTVSGGGTTTLFTIVGANDGAAGGPFTILRRRSGSPAVNDSLALLFWQGSNSVGNDANFTSISARILNPSNAAEAGQGVLNAAIAGTLTPIITWGPGVQIGSPTGGDPGADNLNVSGVIQKDGTQVVAARVTGYGDPFGAVSRATISVTTVTTAALASFVAAMYADLKAHGLIGN
jgi:hypothetical protein